ncbi:unnamed protein product [Rhodiola kirilowii]
MDKSWLQLPRCETRYYEGIDNFVEFVKQNKEELTYPCPCRMCKMHKGGTTLAEMHHHLIVNGMMSDYTTWLLHGERESFNFQNGEGTSSHYMNSTMDLLHDTFHHNYGTDMMNEDVELDTFGKDAYEKYCRLLVEAQRPLYDGSKKTVLELILQAMQAKVECRWSDKSFNKYLELFRDALPSENNYPETYRDVKKILKNLGLTYETIHACEYGCVLYYKEFSELEYCPVCHEPRYANMEGGSKVANKTVRYFPLPPRLQRLYMSHHIAKDMRWHAVNRKKEGDNDLRYPADGDAWQNFNKDFSAFANEI